MAKGGSSTQEMDQEVAQTLFSEGGMFVFLDVPPTTQVGIDCQSWNVGEKFKGIKMIPPGIHFIYYSATSSDGRSAPRTGFFHNFKQGEVLIKKWDPLLEGIKLCTISDEEQTRVESNKQEIDRYLGPYPYDSYRQWVSLTNLITDDLMKRLVPDSGIISSVTEYTTEGSTSESRKAAKEEQLAAGGSGDDTSLPKLNRAPGTSINFVEIPKQKYPPGASAAEMTKYSLDHSYVLETLLNNAYGSKEMDILGEVQFSFVCFLMGQVYEGFEQWKHVVHLLCSCDEALTNHKDLYSNFINIMHFQVRHIPEDFFVDIVTSNNFLVSTLHTFFTNLLSAENCSELQKKGDKFRLNLEKKFGWIFTDTLADEEPVVVE